MGFGNWPLDDAETGVVCGLAIAVVGGILLWIGTVIDWLRNRHD